MTSRHHFYTGLGIIIGLAFFAATKLADLVGGWVPLFAYTSAALCIAAATTTVVSNYFLSKDSK